VRRTLFDAAMVSMFSRKQSSFDGQKIEQDFSYLYREFVNMDEDFELAASSLPHVFLWRFNRAKRFLLEYLKHYMECALSKAASTALPSRKLSNSDKAENSSIRCSGNSDMESTLAQRFIKILRGSNPSGNSNEINRSSSADNIYDSTSSSEKILTLDSPSEVPSSLALQTAVPNWLLAFLWALQVNSLNVAFWTIAHIVTEEGYREKVWKELKDVGFSSASFPCYSDILKKMSLLQCCIHEAIRLHSPVSNVQIRNIF